ncbi:MAG: hypothetical protein CMK76_13345 [Pseudomonadales bacterium]|nr:hypothetical protein [Pseudomonadales bacterium]|tara:strand:- start:4827 stop:5102 length:276 start_codon:yes stop_codon:yes gene_type:complete
MIRPATSKFIATTACILMLVGCSDESDRMRGKFVAGCMQGGAPEPICRCVYTKLEAKYSLADIEQMSNAYETPPETMMRDIIQFAMACDAR